MRGDLEPLAARLAGDVVVDPDKIVAELRVERAVPGVGGLVGPVAAASISARALVGHLASQRVMQKCGLHYAGGFVFPEHVLEDRSESERAGVKYCVTREQWAPPT